MVNSNIKASTKKLKSSMVWLVFHVVLIQASKQWKYCDSP